MILLGRFLRDCLTCGDGATYDDARVLAVLAILVALGCTVYSTWHEGKFDIQSFGIGIGALFSGLGVHLKLRGDQ